MGLDLGLGLGDLEHPNQLQFLSPAGPSSMGMGMGMGGAWAWASLRTGRKQRLRFPHSLHTHPTRPRHRTNSHPPWSTHSPTRGAWWSSRKPQLERAQPRLFLDQGLDRGKQSECASSSFHPSYYHRRRPFAFMHRDEFA